ncbi:MAG: fibrobacter succinogenes major paralogous domain-containing protein [Chitinispirillia bacterium]|nr:fibrobacter succinogenes major paralogous domain-containing protein [Chitinispirillia bacterium]
MQTQKSIIITVLTVCLAIATLMIFGGCGGGKGGSFTDPRDGQTYRTVRIGNLTWMAENLNYASDSSWCYDNDDSNCVTCGRLYNWDAAKAACSTMGAGWRLPVQADWKDLGKILGNEMTAGTKLKSKTGWPKKRNGTDKFGFSLLPCGFRDYRGVYTSYATTAHLWSGEEPKEEHVAYVKSILDQFHYYLVGDDRPKSMRTSVRCVRE